MVAVSDNGIGMSEEGEAPSPRSILHEEPEGCWAEPGVRVRAAVGRSFQIYSGMGHGTTLKTSLPRHIGGGEAEAAPELPYVDAPHGSETVLVVEDDDGVRQYVANAPGAP